MSNKTVLTKSQFTEYRTDYVDAGNQPCILMATVRHDDRCGNGHNTFSVTATLYDRTRNPGGESSLRHATSGKRLFAGSVGCLHDEVAKQLPQLAPYLKWHLCSTDGPMHYIANTMYWVKEGNLKYARESAIWPDATLEQLGNKDLLEARLPTLMQEFQAAIESLGLTY